MGKPEKKRLKLQERLAQLEAELKDSLSKKTHDSAEINVANHLKRINELRVQLADKKGSF
jgi:hypothetical protein